eukprot:429727_1
MINILDTWRDNIEHHSPSFRCHTRQLQKGALSLEFAEHTTRQYNSINDKQTQHEYRLLTASHFHSLGMLELFDNPTSFTPPFLDSNSRMSPISDQFHVSCDSFSRARFTGECVINKGF